MSFILDALKKSEQSRRQTLPDITEIPIASHTPRRPNWWLVLGSVLVLNIMVVGYLIWDPAGDETGLGTVTVAAPVSVQDPRPRRTRPRSTPPQTRSLSAEAGPSMTSSTADTGTVAPARGRVTIDIDDALLPTLGELTATGRTSLPNLHLDMHVYNNNPQQRFVFINAKKYVEGDTLVEGPVVEKITPDAVRLRDGATSFLLPKQ